MRVIIKKGNVQTLKVLVLGKLKSHGSGDSRGIVALSNL
jgi:hypothetical protein